MCYLCQSDRKKPIPGFERISFPLKTDLFDFIFYNLQIRHLPMNKTNLISKAIEKPFSFIFFPTKFLCFYIDTGEKDVENSLNDPLKRRKYICIFFCYLDPCHDVLIVILQTFVNSNDKSKDPDLPLWKDEVYKDEEGIGQDKQDKHQDPLRPAGPL